MTSDPDCIFCKIIAGEIPCFRIYEDEATLAFMDINPAAPGHALVIPKTHAENLYATPNDALAATIRSARKVAEAVKSAVAPDGLNLIQANGPGAAQSVLHFHIHVLPRRDGDGLKINWGPKPGDMGEIEKIAEKIREFL